MLTGTPSILSEGVGDSKYKRTAYLPEVYPVKFRMVLRCTAISWLAMIIFEYQLMLFLIIRIFIGGKEGKELRTH